MTVRWSDLEAALAPDGLRLFGGFHAAEGDLAPDGAVYLAMVGNAGPALFERIGDDLEAQWAAGVRDPLDDWTTARIGAIAAQFEARAYFPFGGPPYHPFQRWAQRADPRFAPSRLGLFIHPEHGVWAGLRAALAFAAEPEGAPAPAPEPADAIASLCATCEDQPCLDACPVDAFATGRYAVDHCAGHLRAEDQASCMERGCAARRACPYGADARPIPIQAAFHMRAFMRNRR